MNFKIVAFGMLAAILPAVLAAQSSSVQMQCHTLASTGNYVAPDETLVNGMACKPVSDPKPIQKMAYTPTPATAVSTAPIPKPVETSPATIPTEAGMYLVTQNGNTKILGQIVDFERSGSLLASKVTLGVKSHKANAQLLGAHSQTASAGTPQFYFIPAKQEADAGVNAGDLIMIRLEEKGDRRQFEVGAEGDWRASKGISLTHQIQLNRSEVKAGVYKIAPAVELSRGEYGLYLARGEGLAPYIYDFSIQ
jgi:hypothetical protein